MKREHKTDNDINHIMKSRAARILAVAVSVFLCSLTLFEYVALRMAWDIPVLAAISGESGGRQNVATMWSGDEVPDAGKAQDGGAETGTDTEIETGTGADTGTETDTGTDTETRTGTNTEEDAGEGEMSGDVRTNAHSGVDAQEGSLAQALTGEPDAAQTQEEPEFPYYIRINRRQNCITIYTPDENGEYTIPYKAMVCSTGLYNTTPRGTYQISTKYLWRELYGGVYGQYATRICGGVLFHSVPYYSRSKSTLCTDKYNKLGEQASMGCVRLTVEDAKWIAENCPKGTTVEIYDDDDPGPLGKPEAAKIDSDSPNKGWDPTDPDEDNPWHEASQDE